MSQNRSRRHHYIPEMLTKNFLDGNCKLQFFEKSTGSFCERTPNGVFWQPHLNTRFVDGGKRGDWTAETKLGQLESVAATVLKRIIDEFDSGHSPQLTNQDVAVCNRFYIHMLFRNPKYAPAILSRMSAEDAYYRACCKLLEQAGLTVPDRLTFDTSAEWEDCKAKIVHNNRASFAAALSSGLQNEIRRFERDKGLAIGIARKNAVKFIVGDCGVTKDAIGDDVPFGWLPVSPRVAIYPEKQPGFIRVVEIEDDHVDAINDYAYRASDGIVGQTKHDLIRAINAAK